MAGRDASGRSRRRERRAPGAGRPGTLPGAALVRGTDKAVRIAARFDLDGHVERARPAPGGHINDSWHISIRGQSAPAYFLQRLNPTVFEHPSRVMENIGRVTDHLEAHRRAGRARRETLALLRTRSGDAWLEEEGGCWRVYRFVAGAHPIPLASKPAAVREAAAAFGEFTRLLSDYRGPALHQTIAGFHDTPSRVARFLDAVGRDGTGRSKAARVEVDAAMRRATLSDVLPPFVERGEVPARIAHNDAKLANVLFDDVTLAARCVVDLDTVMPGSLLFDFGDMVRSMTTGADEDERDLTKVGVRLPFFEAVTAGFLSEVGMILTPRERALLVHAGILITFEQALRFLTDYLEGDRYYRVADPDQNLRRARTQLRHL
ncbi:MAG: phosphotransferase enzyme family protein, partial [Gemmatimonadales bacterium]